MLTHRTDLAHPTDPRITAVVFDQDDKNGPWVWKIAVRKMRRGKPTTVVVAAGFRQPSCDVAIANAEARMLKTTVW